MSDPVSGSSTRSVTGSVETLNGEIVSTDKLSNRAFLYGDGVFTTLKLIQNQPENLQLHWQRLRADSRKLGITTPPFDYFNYCFNKTLPQWQENSAIIRITIFRDGKRGYKGEINKQGLVHILIQELNHFPEVLKLHLVNYRLSRNELIAGVKHLNRLEQIMAAAELTEDFQEAIVLDTESNIVEGIMSNLLWFYDDVYYTPDVTFAGVNGLTRRKLIQGLQNRNKQLKIGFFKIEELYDASAIWMCNAVRGVMQVSAIDTQEFLLDAERTELLKTIINEK